MNPDAARREEGLFRAAASRILRLGLVWVSLLVLFVAPASALSRDVLLIGDSITEGFVSGPGGVDTECAGGLCYAARLETLLGDSFTIVNAGVGGATTVDWTSDVPGIPYADVGGAPTPLFDGLAAPNLPADIVVILLGVNDAIGFFEAVPTTPDAFAANLGELIDRVSSRGAEKVILATPTPLFAFDDIIQERLLQYSEAIHALCMINVDIACGPDLLSTLTAEDFEGGTSIRTHAATNELLPLWPSPSPRFRSLRSRYVSCSGWPDCPALGNPIAHEMPDDRGTRRGHPMDQVPLAREFEAARLTPSG